MASVWVPFTSESKEAIADYDEIRKEMRLALQECGRKLGIYLRRRQRMKKESERRSIFERYIGEISQACNAITGVDTTKLYAALHKQAEKKTAQADQMLDDEGKVTDDGGRLAKDTDVIIIEDLQTGGQVASDEEDLFGGATLKKRRRKSTAKKSKTTRTKKKSRR
jgi:hypothetical protein